MNIVARLNVHCASIGNDQVAMRALIANIQVTTLPKRTSVFDQYTVVVAAGLIPHIRVKVSINVDPTPIPDSQFILVTSVSSIKIVTDLQERIRTGNRDAVVATAGVITYGATL